MSSNTQLDHSVSYTECKELIDFLIAEKIWQEGDTLLSCFKRFYLAPLDLISNIEDEPPATFVLSSDQEKAWQKITTWLVNEKPYFLLRGSAGTGKTSLIKMLAHDNSVYFTATTNKAAKVLSKTIGRPVKTIYSLLGLRMVEDDEQLVLKQAEIAPYMPKGSVIVVDESSMVGNKLLVVILDTITKNKLKVLFVGDPAQLPPVGEKRSDVWTLTDDSTCRSFLKQVMRNDNELLKLATDIRDCIKYRDWNDEVLRVKNSEQIVRYKNRQDFIDKLVDDVKSGCDLHETKVICWRNKSVATYNEIVRNTLGFRDTYNVGDILLLAEPIEVRGNIVAHIDDEFTINHIKDDKVKVDDSYIDTWRLDVVGDQELTLQIPRKLGLLNILLSEKASFAKSQRGKTRAIAWRDFWENKRKFHNVRYGYALTAHRAQGSSYHSVYIDSMDILANSIKAEAYRCLYVAVTRPTAKLYLY